MQKQKAHSKLVGACVCACVVCRLSGADRCVVAYRRLYGISIGFSSIKAKTETNAVRVKALV